MLSILFREYDNLNTYKMTLTRSGRSVNRPAKYVNNDVILMRPAPPIKRLLNETDIRPSVGDGQPFKKAEIVDAAGSTTCHNLSIGRIDSTQESKGEREHRLDLARRLSTGDQVLSPKDNERTPSVIVENYVEEKDDLIAQAPQFFIFPSTADSSSRYVAVGILFAVLRSRPFLIGAGGRI